MAMLVYAAIASLDGYIEDASGNFDWAAPDEEVHAFVNDLERDIGTYLYGRGMYETMAVWESLEDEHSVMKDFAEIWRAANKVVYSTTLTETSTAKTRIERDFDADTVRQMKEASVRDISIGGPNLAAHALAAGLVDEIHLFLVPVLVGGGKPALPDGAHATLELVDEHRFSSGVVHLHYRLEDD